jgi:hypothetical protein
MRQGIAKTDGTAKPTFDDVGDLAHVSLDKTQTRGHGLLTSAGDHGCGGIDTDDLIPLAGEKTGVLTRAATQIQNPSGWTTAQNLLEHRGFALQTLRPSDEAAIFQTRILVRPLGQLRLRR